MRIAFVEQHFLAAAAERDEQADAGDEREALALAAVEHAEDLGGAGVTRAAEQRQRFRIELAAGLVHRMERGDGILELVVRSALDRLAAAVDAIDIAVADILGGTVGTRKRALVDALPGLAGVSVSEAFLADEAAGPLAFDVGAVGRRFAGDAGVVALPFPAGPGDRDAVDHAGLRIGIGADLGIERAIAIVRKTCALAFVRGRRDGGRRGDAVGRLSCDLFVAGQLGKRITGLGAPLAAAGPSPLQARTVTVSGHPAKSARKLFAIRRP